MTILRFVTPILACAALLAPVAVIAQAAAPAPGPLPGLVPPAIQSAKTIFISNAGADSGLFPEPFSGDPSRGYSELLGILQADKSFQVVSSPAQADLVLELQLTAPNGPTRGSKQLGAGDPVPMFRLVVYDRPTHYILWTETQSIEVALLQKTHDRNFDQALNALIAHFLQVAGKSSAPAPPGH